MCTQIMKDFPQFSLASPLFNKQVNSVPLIFPLCAHFRDKTYSPITVGNIGSKEKRISIIYTQSEIYTHMGCIWLSPTVDNISNEKSLNGITLVYFLFIYVCRKNGVPKSKELYYLKWSLLERSLYRHLHTPSRVLILHFWEDKKRRSQSSGSARYRNITFEVSAIKGE